HGSLARAVDQVPERAAEQQPRREPDERAAGVGGEEQHEREQRERRPDDEDRAAARQEAERDARVADVHEIEHPRDQLAPLPELEAGPYERLRQLVERDDGHGDAGGCERGASRAHPRTMFTMIEPMICSAMIATIG